MCMTASVQESGAEISSLPMKGWSVKSELNIHEEMYNI